MQLKLNEDRRELKEHGSFDLPVFVSHERLSSYERGAFSWHWHPEVEFTLFLEGEMEYRVNDRVYCMKEGQGLFCSSNALHTGHMIEGKDCHYLSVTFHPRILYGFEGSRVQKEYVDPILADTSFASAVFYGDTHAERRILQDLKEIGEEAASHSDLHALWIQEKLLNLWRHLIESCRSGKHSISPDEGRNVERIRKALDYLHGHYAEKVTLEDVAGQMNLCRSESCRCFRQYMKQSVFDYLEEYRIERSLELLSETDLSVTEIALRTGFFSPAYFSRIFRRQMNMTPMSYRKGEAPAKKQNGREA